jgi:hypothetical protein
MITPLFTASLLLSACAMDRTSQQELQEGHHDDDDSSVDQTLAWNETLDTGVINSTVNSATALRIGAIVNVSMFDAYNSVHQRYVPIHFTDAAPHGTSERAAIVGAAYRALSAQFPTQQATFDAAKADSVAALQAEGEEQDEIDAGLAWGDQVAQAILAWRATDGFSNSYPAFLGGNATGQWRSTSSPPASMANQSLAFTIPFVLPDALQFREPHPRGLDSADWVSDYNTVKVMGVKTGSGRTQYQTDQAFFYNGYATIDWNEVALQVARARHTNWKDNARNFVRLHVALIDGTITTFGAKRTYAADPTLVTWRPITAIRLGDTDGRDETVPDPAWTPLISTPNHPEYAANHPTNHGTGAGVVIGLYGDHQEEFTIEPQYNSTLPTPPGLPSRTYTSVTAMKQEALDARFLGGMHYPSSNAASAVTGQAIACWVLDNVAQEAHGHGHENDHRDRYIGCGCDENDHGH